MSRMVLGVVLAMALASIAAAQSDCLFKEYDLNDLATIVQGEGYGSVEAMDERTLRFEADGDPYLLLLQEDGDLQMYCVLAGARLAFEDINDWNRRTRLTKALIDEDGDPVLKADLLSDAGINEAIVRNFVGYFARQFGPDFRKFVNERNRAR